MVIVHRGLIGLIISVQIQVLEISRPYMSCVA